MLRSWTPRELVALVADKPPEFPRRQALGVFEHQLRARRPDHRARAGPPSRRRARAAHLRAAAPARHLASPSTRPPSRAATQRLLARLRRLLRPMRQAARRHGVQPVGHLGGRQLACTAADIAHFWRAAARRQAARSGTADGDEDHGARPGRGRRSATASAFRSSPAPAGRVLGNGGDIAGYSNSSRTARTGGARPPSIVNVNPPRTRSGEARGRRPRTQALSTALGGTACAGGS